MTGRGPIGARLIERAEDYYDLPPGSICDNRRRNGNISKARWAVAHVLLTECGYSQPRVGKLFGQDHKAITYGKRQAETLVRECPLFFEAVRLLKEEIAPHVSDTSI